MEGQSHTTPTTDTQQVFVTAFAAGNTMPLLLIAIVLALPLLDIYATIRLAEALSVPGWSLFIPSAVFGMLLMRRETRSLKTRFVGAVQSMTLQGMVFDSGRRMIAGVLLLLPGVVSDLFAIFLLVMPNRVAAATNAGRSVPPTGPGTGTRATVDGEFRRVD
jgi:UPF0716 protein FxsA